MSAMVACFSGSRAQLIQAMNMYPISTKQSNATIYAGHVVCGGWETSKMSVGRRTILTQTSWTTSE